MQSFAMYYETGTLNAVNADMVILKVALMVDYTGDLWGRARRRYVHAGTISKNIPYMAPTAVIINGILLIVIISLFSPSTEHKCVSSSYEIRIITLWCSIIIFFLTVQIILCTSFLTLLYCITMLTYMISGYQRFQKARTELIFLYQ